MTIPSDDLIRSTIDRMKEAAVQKSNQKADQLNEDQQVLTAFEEIRSHLQSMKEGLESTGFQAKIEEGRPTTPITASTILTVDGTTAVSMSHLNLKELPIRIRFELRGNKTSVAYLRGTHSTAPSVDWITLDEDIDMFGQVEETTMKLLEEAWMVSLRSRG